MADTTHPITAAPGAKRIDPHEVGTGRHAPRFPDDRHRRLRRGRRRRHALALHRPDEPRRGGAGARFHRGRRFVDRARPVASSSMWHGKPVSIRYRTEAEMKAAQEVPLDDLPDPIARNANLDSSAPATDENRARRRQRAMARHGAASARISAACRSASRAITAAGSAPATARNTTPRGASAADRRRRTWRSRPTPSRPTRHLRIG